MSRMTGVPKDVVDVLFEASVVNDLPTILAAVCTVLFSFLQSRAVKLPKHTAIQPASTLSVIDR